MIDPVKTYRATARTAAPQATKPATRAKTPFWHWAVPLAVVFVVVGVIGTARQGNAPTETTAATPVTQTGGVQAASYSDVPALDQMAAVFIGNYSREEIKQQVDGVLLLYGQALTEENYRKLGDNLVYLREHGDRSMTEMDILHCMRSLAIESGDIRSTPEQAANFCSTLGEVGLQ